MSTQEASSHSSWHSLCQSWCHSVSKWRNKWFKDHWIGFCVTHSRSKTTTVSHLRKL